MDNVIYAKQKMIKEGKRSPQRAGIFLNRRDISKFTGSATRMPTCNRYTKEFQEQPSDICEVARVASRLLYQIYSTDERFTVDELERSRLGIGNSDDFIVMDCEEHGGGLDATRAKKREAYLKAIAFYEDLKDPRHNKVNQDLQARTLIEKIKVSREPEFAELRKELLDMSENRNMKYEELRKLRPQIFLQNKEPMPPHQWHNTAGGDIHEVSNVVDIEHSDLLAPSKKRVFANRMVLQTFTNTFKPSMGSPVRPNFDTE